MNKKKSNKESKYKFQWPRAEGNKHIRKLSYFIISFWPR